MLQVTALAAGPGGGTPEQRAEAVAANWKCFLTDPSQYHDNRKRLKQRNAPDFVHKLAWSSPELHHHKSLWLSIAPPWAKQALQDLDGGRLQDDAGNPVLKVSALLCAPKGPLPQVNPIHTVHCCFNQEE